MISDQEARHRCTLTRPLSIEARGVAQLVSAAELVALYGFCLAGWKRTRNLPKMLVTNPYVAFAVTAVFLGALAYSSFANLGILTRQKSLLMPVLLLVPCLLRFVPRREGVPVDRRADALTTRPLRAVAAARD